MLATVIINGNLCELSVDSQAITWWRKPTRGRLREQVSGQHLSGAGLSNQNVSNDGSSPATIIGKTIPDSDESGKQLSSCPPLPLVDGGDQAQNGNAPVGKRKQIDFIQVIGATRVCSGRKKQTKSNEKDSNNNKNQQRHDIFSETREVLFFNKEPQVNCGDNNHHQEQHRQKQESQKNDGVNQEPGDCSIRKLKIYHVEKRDNKKFSGRLLKLKKIAIELPSSPLSPSFPDTSSSSSSTSSSEQKQEQRSNVNNSETKQGIDNNCDVCTLSDIYKHIEQHLELVRRQRPRRLLIFANPFGGKGKALPLYERKVKRVLDLANIESQLIVTKYANHARETLEDPQFNVDYFDGIICIGGDGMFSELMNGLLFRFNRDKLLTNTNGRAPYGAGSSSSDLDSLGSSSTIDQADVTNCNRISSSSGSSSRGSGGTNSRSDEQETKVIQDENIINSNNSDNDAVDEGINMAKSTDAKETRSTGATNGNNCLSGPNAHETESRSIISRQQLEFLRSSLGGIGKKFHSPTIPIGVIGAGSTDANLFGFIGTNDAVTATLNIVLGNQIQIDVGSVHSFVDDKLLRFISTFVAYGYFGDVVRESEQLRWMGPSRYDITALNTLIKYRSYEGLVRILRSSQDGTPRDPSRCHLDCGLCQNNITNPLNFGDLSQLDDISEVNTEIALGESIKANVGCESGKSDDGASTIVAPASSSELSGSYEIIEKQGPFVGVNAAITACRCPQTKKGFSPGNHLANGCADLILVRPCTRMQYINYLIRTGYTQKSAFDLKYVEAYRCRQFEFIVKRQLGQEAAADVLLGTDGRSSLSSQAPLSTWNADGEILHEQSIRVKVNNKVLRVFGTGEPVPSATRKTVRARHNLAG